MVLIGESFSVSAKHEICLRIGRENEGRGNFLETYLKIILHFSNISNHEQIMFLKSFRQCIAMWIVHKIIKEMVYYIETSGKWGRGLSRKHIWKLFLPHFQSPTNHVSQKLPTIWRNYKKKGTVYFCYYAEASGKWEAGGFPGNIFERNSPFFKYFRSLTNYVSQKLPTMRIVLKTIQKVYCEARPLAGQFTKYLFFSCKKAAEDRKW